MTRQCSMCGTRQMKHPKKIWLGVYKWYDYKTGEEFLACVPCHESIPKPYYTAHRSH